jgi:aminoglycoside 2'-N-acetyltransferase I
MNPVGADSRVAATPAQPAGATVSSIPTVRHTLLVRVLSFPEAETPPELRAQVRNLQTEAWPTETLSAAAVAKSVHDPVLRPTSMLLVEEHDVVAALDILSKEIVHAGQRYRAGGLSTVVTRKAARGRGYAHRLVAAAREAMPTFDLDLGIFTCDRPLRELYQKAGWHVLPGAVLIGGTPEQPFPSDQPGFDKLTMADFFSPTAIAGEQSFHNSRIGLYSGDIDKLW